LRHCRKGRRSRGGLILARIDGHDRSPSSGNLEGMSAESAPQVENPVAIVKA
jgi:hypothetical protein